MKVIKVRTAEFKKMTFDDDINERSKKDDSVK